MLQDYRVTQFATLFSDGIEAEMQASPAERRKRRAEVLRENPGRTLARLASDLTHALSPRALLGLPGTIDFIVREKSIGVADLPDPRRARRVPDGLAGLAADLSPGAILDAYSRGLFLRWMMGQPSYWAPQARMTATPAVCADFVDAGALLKQDGYRITLDREFEAVVNGAAMDAISRRAAYAPSPAGMNAFAQLHDAGFAHSVEIRNRDGALAGGVYGIACGRVFVIQARFGETPAVADLAVAALARHLREWDYDSIDGCADTTLARAGFREISRTAHLASLPHTLGGGRPGRWLVLPGLLG